MKLEVGMYVRSKINGMISKITDIEQFEELGQIVERYILDNNYNVGFCSTEKDSVIASHNIIDLIEVGDFITLGENNYPLQIRNLWEHGGDIHIELSNGARIEDLHYNEDFKIYSIVTKEQFESMSYKAGE